MEREVLTNAFLFTFSGCSLIGRSHPVEPFSFTGARGISDGFVLAQIVAILLDCFVFYTT